MSGHTQTLAFSVPACASGFDVNSNEEEFNNTLLLFHFLIILFQSACSQNVCLSCIVTLMLYRSIKEDVKKI